MARGETQDGEGDFGSRYSRWVQSSRFAEGIDGRYLLLEDKTRCGGGVGAASGFFRVSTHCRVSASYLSYLGYYTIVACAVA